MRVVATYQLPFLCVKGCTNFYILTRLNRCIRRESYLEANVICGIHRRREVSNFGGIDPDPGGLGGGKF